MTHCSGNQVLKSLNIKKCIHTELPQIVYFSYCFSHEQYCSVLAISYLGAKHDSEIWAFKVFFFFGQEKHPLEWLLEAQTYQNWKQYTGDSSQGMS